MATVSDDPTLDDVVRTLVRKELEAGGRPVLKPAPPPSLHEAIVLVVIALNVGMFVALFPQASETVTPAWKVIATLGSGVFALGYAWLRAQFVMALRHSATTVAAVLILCLLIVAHGLRNAPVVPVETQPSSASLYVDGEGPVDSRFVTVRAHTLEARGLRDWDRTQPRVVQVSGNDGLQTFLWRRTPIQVPPLLCSTSIEFTIEDPLSVELTRCRGGSDPCIPEPFDDDFMDKATQQNGFVPPGAEMSNTGRIVFPAATAADITIPVGSYRVALQHGSCAAPREPQRWELEARSCATFRAEANRPCAMSVSTGNGG